MTDRPTLDPLKATILASFPELAAARFTLADQGWDCAAVDVDGAWIFKFPRDPEDAGALAVEARVLDIVRPRVAVAVPEMTFHPGPPPFSRHAKLIGEHLVAADYDRLDPAQRDALAATLASFLAALHELERAPLAAAGAVAIDPPPAVDAIAAGAIPRLPPALRGRAERILADYAALAPDPHGTVFGFFDAHGWNMAFDHAAGRLNGIYDFGDAGFGPLHEEFVETSFIARDLTRRTIAAYERVSGRSIDRTRVATLTGAFRLHELAEDADHPVHGATVVRHAIDWLSD